MQRCDALQREHAALSKEEQILRGKLGRSETDVARLNELKQEMGERVQQLERVKSDQTDVIGRWVLEFEIVVMMYSWRNIVVVNFQRVALVSYKWTSDFIPTPNFAASGGRKNHRMIASLHTLK